MITKIRISNFKALKNTEVNLAPMLVLTGANSVGKSTLTQAILLFKDACTGACKKKENIPLNNDHLNLCNIENIFSYGSYDEFLNIEIISGDEKGKIALDVDEKNFDKGADQYLVLRKKEGIGKAIKHMFADEKTGIFTYLSAERFGPRDYQIRQNKGFKFLNIGCRGQYCAELIEAYGNSKIENSGISITEIDNLKYPRTLLKQIEAWMYKIGFPLELRSESSLIAGVRALRFRDKNSSDAEWVSPVHIGFGISYCLPIVVAGLLAKPGGIFIVDSPEAHLHPAAQSEIAKFLAKLAASGVQVIVETHSDHVLNGIRIANFQHMIPSEDVLFLSFSNNQGSLIVDEIKINEDGSLTNWPKTFFDQIEFDLALIAKSRKTRVV